MPTQHADTSRAAHPSQPTTSTPNYIYPLTPPSDRDGRDGSAEVVVPCGDTGEDAVDDNTAAGMSFAQEESMYRSHETTADMDSNDLQAFADKEKIPPIHELYAAAEAQAQANRNQTETPASADNDDRQDSTSSPGSGDLILDQTGLGNAETGSKERYEMRIDNPQQMSDSSLCAEGLPLGPSPERMTHSLDPAATFPGLCASERPTDSQYRTNPWDFSYIPLNSQYPSSLLHPGSKFEGTQQSDKQIYSVTVTMHTVDVPQCTVSGYLKIEGLTPDHPTLTTFFTGEIIGGPDQRYSFQTRHASWGATDKTDLIHWARFPAWKPLSREAKRDISFEYPVPGTGLLGNDSWWQQEHIYMRWKEWFLVPDHRVRSIQGASFEGFYYICFNQIEGRISGIYFHARSEKYQQLELKHEGEKGIWNKGVRPAMEFR